MVSESFSSTHDPTSEFEPSKVARARQNLADGGLIDLVEIRKGDALRTLNGDLPARIDLLLLDGAKSLYREVLDLVEDRLSPGAWIVADKADYWPNISPVFALQRQDTCPCPSRKTLS